MAYKRINMTPSVSTIGSLLSNVRNVHQNGLDISPDYQRGYVWSDDFKDQLIISIMLKYPIGNVVVNQLPTPNERNATQELVDGKQRITTILKFVDNGNIDESIISTDDTWSKLGIKATAQAKGIIEKIANDSGNEEIQKMSKVKRLTFRDLPKFMQSYITEYELPVYSMTSASPEQIRDFFKVLQNHEKLKAGEIINALPDNPLLDYFQKVSGDFLAKVNYENLKRSEFEKLYYSVIGLWFGAIQLNSQDQKTIEFVDGLEVLSDTQIHDIQVMNRNLNYIAGLSTSATPYRRSKRTMKLLLGLALYKEEYFEQDGLAKVEFVCELSSRLAAFNSSESEDIRFSKHFGDEYSLQKEHFMNHLAPKYREIFKATAKSISKPVFTNALDLLVEMFAELQSGDRTSRTNY